MAYDYRYILLQAPFSNQNGGGIVEHEILAQYSSDSGATWSDVPDRRRYFHIPAQEIEDMIALGGTEKQRATRYLALIAKNIQTEVEGVDGWFPAQLEMLCAAVDLSDAQATIIDAYITTALSLAYPVAWVSDGAGQYTLEHIDYEV